jgi:hypothetical protein
VPRDRGNRKVSENFPDALTPQARNVGPSGQGLSPICPQTAPPFGASRVEQAASAQRPGPDPDSGMFRARNRNFSAGSIDDPSSMPQSSLSEEAVMVRDIEPLRPRAICAARQIHAQLHGRSAHQSTCATPFRSGEVRTSASWLFAKSERYATARGGPTAEPRWSTPCLCRNTAAARRPPPAARRPPPAARRPPPAVRQPTADRLPSRAG